MKNLSLAWRIAALSVAIAVLTALLAGALTAGLVRNNGEAGARANLARLADVAQSTVSHAVRTGRAETRLRTLLAGLSIRTGTVSSTGVISTAAPVIRRLMNPARVSTLVSGQSLSVEQSVAGDTVFLEARPVPGGGIVLAQRRADALAPNQQAIRRTLLALVIAAGIATVLGALVAWRIARPLRRTATAAHALAVGDRDVAVPADGPREVAEVADAVTSLAAALRISEGRQRDFLMSVSHDLRTPLTALRGYAESLADGAIDADDAPRVGAAMTEEARRMELLVGDLLDLARLDADDFRIAPVPVDLRTVVEGAAEVYRARTAQEGIEFALEMPDEAVPATTDAQRLRQALDGLFDNALRLTPTRGLIVLALRPEPSTQSALLEVRDSGPGLTDADLADAFTRGTLTARYEGARRVGTGLGLAIVHGLITRLGGSAEASHAPEGGACFRLRLPLSA